MNKCTRCGLPFEEGDTQIQSALHPHTYSHATVPGNICIERLRAEVEALKAQVDATDPLGNELRRTNLEAADVIRRLRAENEALRYLLNGIASPANIESAIRYTQIAIAPQRRGE